jgi:hypothetical protein
MESAYYNALLSECQEMEWQVRKNRRENAAYAIKVHAILQSGAPGGRGR